MLGTSVLSISKGDYPQQAIGIVDLEFFQRLSSGDYSVEHESGAARGSFGDEAVEVINGLSESTLVLHTVVEKEEGDYVFEVVCDGAEGECLEEGLYCSDSPQIGLIEE